MDDDDTMATSTVADDSSDVSNESETELMVTTRGRRTTAGNRYNTVVAQEQAVAEDDAEDDVALLFAEIEGEDEEYHSDDGADDADMSSSDDDDQGPNAAVNDVEGEKEIQLEAKAERAKKRKADLALTSLSGIRKKPKIDPTALRRAPVSKPSKRKERVSWLPDQGFTSGRTSLRKQTIMHRAETHAKLKKNEQQRLKAKAIRAQREKDREADAPKELTQADRLAEAERVERRNAKSLNRWEAMEKKRQEEQAARLAALKDRKLKGAVISTHSARHVFQGWRSSNPDGEGGEVKKRGRKSKAYLEQLAAAKTMQETSGASASAAQGDALAHEATPSSNPGCVQKSAVPTQTEEDPTQPATTDPKTSEAPIEIRLQETLPDDVDTLPMEPVGSPAEDSPKKPADVHSDAGDEVKDQSEKLPGLPKELSGNAQVLVDHQEAEQTETHATKQTGIRNPGLTDISTTPGPSLAVQQGITTMPDRGQDLQETDSGAAAEVALASSMPEVSVIKTDTDIPHSHADLEPPAGLSADLQAMSAQVAPVPEVISIRNLVVLENFDSLPNQVRGDYNLFYMTKKTSSKPIKHTPELCLITGLPVRYRDPVTGIGYHNAMAYKKLKELREHRFVWSSMLGCYTGSANLVARGVPEGFSGSGN